MTRKRTKKTKPTKRPKTRAEAQAWLRAQMKSGKLDPVLLYFFTGFAPAEEVFGPEPGGGA